MVHTLLRPDKRQAEERFRPIFVDYLKTHLDLVGALQKRLDFQFDATLASPRELDALLEMAADFYLQERVVVGDVRSCERMLASFAGMGVTEVAFLLDFCQSPDDIWKSLEVLGQVQMRQHKHLGDLNS